MQSLLAILGLGLCVACGDSSLPRTDGGSLDAEVPDFGAADALVADQGTDAGPETLDAGTGDVGLDDFGSGCDEACRALTELRDGLVQIPAGVFSMGSDRDEPGAHGLEFPIHDVTITRDFLMSATEITQGQYRAVLGVEPSFYSYCGDQCPVDSVSWNDAIEFCRQLSALEGLEDCYEPVGGELRLKSLDCDGYRLPTEAEWEYAARGGSYDSFYTGDITVLDAGDPACAVLDPAIDAAAWYCANSGLETHVVGQKAVNPFGLYDVLGNVWEWVYDWEYAYESAAVVDPIYDVDATGNSRKMRRGGAYRTTPRTSRSAYRVPDLLTGRHYCIGFRIVRTLASE